MLALNTPLPEEDRTELSMKLVSTLKNQISNLLVLFFLFFVRVQALNPNIWILFAVTQQENAELYFVLIFCIEALLKIMAYGFLLHPGSYLRNVWNILDFVVVVIG